METGQNTDSIDVQAVNQSEEGESDNIEVTEVNENSEEVTASESSDDTSADNRSSNTEAQSKGIKSGPSQWGSRWVGPVTKEEVLRQASRALQMFKNDPDRAILLNVTKYPMELHSEHVQIEPLRYMQRHCIPDFTRESVIQWSGEVFSIKTDEYKPTEEGLQIVEWLREIPRAGQRLFLLGTPSQARAYPGIILAPEMVRVQKITLAGPVFDHNERPVYVQKGLMNKFISSDPCLDVIGVDANTD